MPTYKTYPHVKAESIPSDLWSGKFTPLATCYKGQSVPFIIFPAREDSLHHKDAVSLKNYLVKTYGFKTEDKIYLDR